MIQNKIYRFFLLAGSLMFFFTFSQCGKPDVEYLLNTDLVFINNSKYNIEYVKLFELTPGESHTVAIDLDGDYENPEINTCCTMLLHDFQGDYFQVYVRANDTLCLFFAEDEGTTSLDNYEKRVVADRHFQYTYTFTDENMKDLEICNGK